MRPKPPALETAKTRDHQLLQTLRYPLKTDLHGKTSKIFLSDNAVWAGINVFLIVALITLLLVAAFPVGGVFALGPLSALAVVGIIGGGALLLWNVGYAIFKGLGGGGEPPSTVLDGSKTTIGPSVVPTNSQPSTVGYQPGLLSQQGTEQQNTGPQTGSSGTQTSSKTPTHGSGNGE